MLMFTTTGSRPELHFVGIMELRKVWDPLEGDETGNRPTIGDVFETRSVERGARLVAVIPSSPLVVLQVSAETTVVVVVVVVVAALPSTNGGCFHG